MWSPQAHGSTRPELICETVGIKPDQTLPQSDNRKSSGNERSFIALEQLSRRRYHSCHPMDGHQSGHGGSVVVVVAGMHGYGVVSVAVGAVVSRAVGAVVVVAIVVVVVTVVMAVGVVVVVAVVFVVVVAVGVAVVVVAHVAAVHFS
eukprot:gnl/TRDRNA2_/TRDRNA2_168969_c2_seq2.p2 gnl/TRDRNA2_/TRDRNA2_168969_c2~~gnl/TRDRNA2_/TRDRNA2_168969_c2_seq2.p2  ORF type:complete len:147 (+),score=17.61 gnl/TRDRNA2_/TRDRNA2_168969_c2_seq2:178-618(+)